MTGIVPGGAPFRSSVQNLWAAEDSALPSEKADHDRMESLLQQSDVSSYHTNMRYLCYSMHTCCSSILC